MEAVLLVIHLIVSAAIIVVVLIQPSDAGGFLGTGGGGGNMMAPRRQADVLTRVTAALATCFFITSLTLAILASRAPEKKSILDVMPSATQEAPAEAGTDATKETTAPPAKADAETDTTPTAPVSK